MFHKVKRKLSESTRKLPFFNDWKEISAYQAD